ncbi:DUF3800 domain-containing protein [Paenibacillus glacialis]|uniref:DUF3800 domain-containing protein n=1 Tax=Paenibacillus glacialis TaxID=494026 RepID=A0A168M3G3_9BACL|nr:DUF3800 domain-containing protein [Paenibacillus glacialis]OAB44171.1 hypothetical protein PGLA_05730 [Paenibacillus glacialis]
MNTLSVFIDESGNTGEAIILHKNNIFGNQPIFSLGAIGILDFQKDNLENYLAVLKTKHRVQGDELKAKNLYSSKPKFVLELIEYLLVNQIPIFVEIMDKKYYLSTQIIENTIFKRTNVMVTDKHLELRRIIADYLFLNLDNNHYQLFSVLCRQPNKENYNAFMISTILMLKSKSDDIGKSLLKHFEYTLEEAKEYENSDANYNYEDFIPYPDMNRKNQEIRLLPNLHAYTNIIARAEKYRVNNKIEKIDFIHDEQSNFEHIFLTYANLMKNTKFDSNFYTSSLSKKVKFSIEDSSEFIFERSQLTAQSIFIQIADIIAGVLMRVWENFVKQNKIPKEYIKVADLIIETTNHYGTTGINFVVNSSDLTNFENL